MARLHYHESDPYGDTYESPSRTGGISHRSEAGRIVEYWGPSGDPELPGILRHELHHMYEGGRLEVLRKTFQESGLSEWTAQAAEKVYEEMLANYEQLHVGGSVRQVRSQLMSYVRPLLKDNEFTRAELLALDASARRVAGWRGPSVLPKRWRK